MELEIVRPNALKRLMNDANGASIRITSIDLAKLKLNWPKNSIHPPHSHIVAASLDIDNLLNNTPDGWEVEEIGGKYYSILIRRVEDANP